MSITLQTTIYQLRDLGKISVRTYNCLIYAGYETINDIVSDIKKAEDLLNIRNFGKKSYEEMLKVFIKLTNFTFGNESSEYENFDENLFSITEMAYKSVITENEHFKPLFPSFQELHTCIFRNKDKLLKAQPDLSKDDNIAIRYCIKTYIETVLESILQNHKYEAVAKTYQKVLSYIEDNINAFTDLENFMYFNNAELNNHLQTIYNEYCAKMLSARTRNFQMIYLPKVENILPYFNAELIDYYKIHPNTYAKKTIQELFDFTQKFKEVYHKNTNKTANEIKTNSFPYLLSNQKKFLADYNQQYGHLPYWYILYQYLKVSNNRDDQIYSYLYGIYDGKEWSLEEIGNYIGLSSERVRQIAKHNNGVTKKYEIIDGISQNYQSLLSLPYITEDSIEYKYIRSTERINVDYKIFARLITLVAGFNIEDVNGKVILLSNKHFPNFYLSRCIRIFENKLSAKYAEDTIVTMDDILSESSCKNTESAKELLYYVITKILGKNLTRNGSITIKQNYIDVSKEIYGILERNGSPMSLEEIFNVFKVKYPDHSINDASDLRKYILNTERIKAIGKQSTYALDFWDNINFSSIRDLIIKKLSSSETPVHINDIFKYVSKHYPKTNIKSLFSTMQSDELERFVRFENGFFGLTSKQYPDSFYKAQIFRKADFEERIKDYRQFIETYHRFPYSLESEIEGALSRWAYRIINNIIDITPEQRVLFDDMMKSYEKSGYPRNGHENAFLNNCNDFKDFVEKHHKLPSITTNRFLCNWYYRSKANYNSYTDQRRQYLTDLFDYITSYGFKI